MTAFKVGGQNLQLGKQMDKVVINLANQRNLKHQCLQWWKLTRSKLILAIEGQQIQQPETPGVSGGSSAGTIGNGID